MTGSFYRKEEGEYSVYALKQDPYNRHHQSERYLRKAWRANSLGPTPLKLFD